MRRVILAAFLICPAVVAAQNAAAPPPTAPSAVRTIPAPAPPAPAAAKAPDKAGQSEQTKTDKTAQEKSQKANDALVERHNAAANRAIGGICAGCVRGAARPRTAARRAQVRRHARVAPDESDEERSYGAAERSYLERQPAGPLQPAASPRDRWWNSR